MTAGGEREHDIALLTIHNDPPHQIGLQPRVAVLDQR